MIRDERSGPVKSLTTWMEWRTSQYEGFSPVHVYQDYPFILLERTLARPALDLWFRFAGTVTAVAADVPWIRPLRCQTLGCVQDGLLPADRNELKIRPLRGSEMVPDAGFPGQKTTTVTEASFHVDLSLLQPVVAYVPSVQVNDVWVHVVVQAVSSVMPNLEPSPSQRLHLLSDVARLTQPPMTTTPGQAGPAICNACGQSNDIDARFCVGCGNSSIGVAATTQWQPAQPDAFCTWCGFKNPTDSRFCMGCARPLS